MGFVILLKEKNLFAFSAFSRKVSAGKHVYYQKALI
jgi:hypothetical protein